MTTTWNDERGANLANWRKRNGMTQVGLGNMVGVSKSTISAWERNERAPSPEQIEALHAVADELAERIRGRLAAHELNASGGDAPASDDDAVLTERMVDAARNNGVEAAAPKLDPYTATIDWQALVWSGEVDGQPARGVSLRAMVEAGLYSRFEDAEAAVERGDYRVLRVTRKSGGRPGREILFADVREAQRYALRARTEVGAQIAELILDHHDEFQRLLRGDRDAHERLADAQPNPAPETPDDPVMAILAAAAETRRAQLAQEARLAALEHQMARASAQVADVVDVVEDMREQQLADGEVYVGALADQHGWLTEAGNGYTRAVLRSLELAGARGHTRQIRRAAHHEGRAYHDVWVISAQGARLWRDQIRPEWEGLAEDGVVTLPGKMRCFVHLRGGEG